MSSDVHSILFAKGVFLRFALGFATFAAFDTIPLWAIASLKAGGLDLTRADLAITLTVASGVQVFTLSDSWHLSWKDGDCGARS